MSLPTNHMMEEQHGIMYHIHGFAVGILESMISCLHTTHLSFTMSLVFINASPFVHVHGL